MSTQPPEKAPENKKKSRLAIIAASVGLLLTAIVTYKAMLKIKEQQLVENSGQEQFAGTVQVSEQLQAECQASAEKITSYSGSSVGATDIAKMFAEYRQNAENCREVYFSIEKKAQFRSEGTYPDLIVDIALLAAKTNKTEAIEMLNFAKNISPWEFYMGPVICNSKTTIEAYLESLNSVGEKICFNPDTDREKLSSEIKNKKFSVLAASLQGDRVVSLALMNSEIGCPEKISNITKIIEKASSDKLSIEEEKPTSPGGSAAQSLNFVFKTDTESKLVLEFAAIDNCLQLQSVLIPEQQVNE